MKKITLILLIFSHFSNNAQIITTIAGNGTEGFAGDGKHIVTGKQIGRAHV